MLFFVVIIETFDHVPSPIFLTDWFSTNLNMQHYERITYTYTQKMKFSTNFDMPNLRNSLYIYTKNEKRASLSPI